MAKTPFGLLCFKRDSTSPTTARTPASRAKQKLINTSVNSTKPSLPELHINLWERDTSKSYEFAHIESFIDIGLMLDVTDVSSSFEILVPWQTKVEDIVDLSSQITTLDAIHAIFNESWTITNGTGGWIVEDPSGTTAPFAIVAAMPGSAIKSSTYTMPDGNRYGITIGVQSLIQQAKQAAATTRLKTTEKFYVRFRLRNADRGAYCVGVNENTNWWVPSWQRTDVIDFRVNVRRGAPTNIENIVKGTFMDFAKIQLFMMRDRNQDIVYQDKFFKACRSLEDEEFWASYSLHTSDSLDKVRRNVKRSMGYQWKYDGEGKPVREFGISARFKVVEFGIGKYIAAALILGAFGSGLWDLSKGYIWDPMPLPKTSQAVCVNLEQIVTQSRQACSPGVKKEQVSVQRKESQ
jgi:hypothetical protein